MIRQDYILRMIAEFLEMLSRIQAFKKGQLWREAQTTLDEECRRLVGTNVQEMSRLSETEVLARVIHGEPTQAVRDKVQLLTTLFKEAGDVASGQGRSEESRAFYLKGLHLLFYTLAQGEPADWPEFVPRVEMFMAALGDSPLPLPTQAGLMQHFERTGQFAKAEDAFYRMLETEPDYPGLARFGISFYERLRGQTDANLIAGNLPRGELEAGLAELRQKSTLET